MADLQQRFYDLYRIPDNAVKLQGLPGWQPDTISERNKQRRPAASRRASDVFTGYFFR